jgi:hypothetical protein
LEKLNILVAIPYLKPDSIDYLKSIEGKFDLLLDSGAFTQWKKGIEPNIEEYMSFINKLEIKPWRYFTLDVVGNAERTHWNFSHLINEGFDPVPIFTRGDSVEELEFYYKHSDLVGIGGLVGTQGNRGFVKGIMNHVGDRKAHWLGFTSNNFIATYKPYSCDSSSWSAGLQYGILRLYAGLGQWVVVRKTDFLKRPSEKVCKLLRDYYHIDPSDLSKIAQWRNAGNNKTPTLLRILSFRSYVWYSLDCERVLGTKMFLAGANFYDIEGFFIAYNFWQKHPLIRAMLPRPSGQIDRTLDRQI